MSSIAILHEQRLFQLSLNNLIQTFEGCSVDISIPCFRYLPTKAHHPEIDLVICSLEGYENIKKNEHSSIDDIFPNARVIVITESITNTKFHELMQSGINGLFSKNSNPEEFKSAVLSRHNNQLIIGSEIHDEFLTYSDTHQQSPTFTPRELEVLQLVCLEKTNAEISKILGLSIRTVETFRRKIILKSDCKNIIGVILKTLHYEPGLIPEPKRA